jgi:hypothetical protein
VKIHYRVMLRCPSGCIRLVSDTIGARWEQVMTTLTWCFEDSLEEAQAKANDLMTGTRYTQAWVVPEQTNERHLTTLPMTW